MLLLLETREELLHSDRSLGSCLSSRSSFDSIVLEVRESFEHELGSGAGSDFQGRNDTTRRKDGGSQLRRGQVRGGRGDGGRGEEETNLIVAVSIPAVFSWTI